MVLVKFSNFKVDFRLFSFFFLRKQRPTVVLQESLRGEVVSLMEPVVGGGVVGPGPALSKYNNCGNLRLLGRNSTSPDLIMSQNKGAFETISPIKLSPETTFFEIVLHFSVRR